MSFSPNRHRNLLLLSISAVLLSVLLIAGLFQNQQASTKAEQATVEHGELLLKQTSLLANPLLLSNDRVSLNYLLNELITLPYIRAAQLKTNREGVIARAGDGGGIEMQQALSSKQDSHLSIWLDPAPFSRPLQQQLKTSAIFALAALIGSLLTVIMLNRQQPRYNRQAEDSETPMEPSLSHSLDRAYTADEVPEENTLPVEFTTQQPEAETPSQETERTEQPTACQDQGSEQMDPTIENDLPQSPQASLTEQPHTDTQHSEIPTKPEPDQEAATSVNAEQSPSLSEEIPFIEDFQDQPPMRVTVDESLQILDQPGTQPSSAFDSTEPSSPEGTPPHSAELPADIPFIGGARRESQREATPKKPSSTNSSRTEPSLETQSLVSLLRPDQHDRSMPQFQPSAPDTERSDLTKTPPDFEETTPGPGLQQSPPEPGTSQKPNPLTAERNHEEQLSLYTMEHELELALSPEQAGYCLYIDTSAHAGNVEETERQQLLRVYARLAGQTAALYNGNIAELTNGDIFVRFDRTLPDDSHGINALCASALFNLLYKGFNQSRIRAFKPALNLRMSLARGHQAKDQLLLEEARFLTHTTQSNDLISHTALTEASILKEKLLYQADIRREDEDKVLIISLTEKVQQLLLKQRDQLLAKLK